MDFDQCPCSGRSLGKLIQPAIMAVLAGGAVHGYRIAQRLARMAMFKGRSPDATGIYRLLRSMERSGLVVSTWDLSGAGPAKRRYRLTPRGRACLRQWTVTLRGYGEAIAELLETAELAAGRRQAPAHRRRSAG